jgi:thiol:disulfide interchange protein DsbD
MVDFTANWCAPCHELERLTFTDRRVRDAARDFHAFRVDLTHYNSPESEALRLSFRIRSVPTVLFVVPGGNEVRAARVEGFLGAKDFLERMRTAQAETKQAAAD